MKDRWLFLSLIASVLVVLCGAFPGSAEERSTIRTQALVNTGSDLKSGYLLINEMRVSVDSNTKVLDHRQVPIPVTEIKPKRWVYVELEKNTRQKIIRVTKIYLLPSYVNQKSKKDFPFMK